MIWWNCRIFLWMIWLRTSGVSPVFFFDCVENEVQGLFRDDDVPRLPCHIGSKLNPAVVFTDSAIPLILASPHLHPGTTLDPNKDYTRTEIIKLKEGRPLVGRGSRGATSRVTGSRRRDGHGELKGEGVRIQKKKKGEPEIMGGWTGPVLTVGGIPRKRPGKVVSRVGGGGLAIGAVGVPVRSREGVGEASAGVSQRVEDDEEEEEKEDDGPGSENDDDEMEVDEDVDEDEDEEMDEERGSEDPGDGDEDTGS